MVILVIGSPEDAHAAHMVDFCQAQGQSACFFDTRLFPSQIELGLYPQDAAEGGFIRLEHGQRINLDDIESIYWRYHHGIQLPEGLPQELTDLVFRETEACLGSFCRMTPHIHWVNDVIAVERHRYKPVQLQLLQQAGLPIPKTLISNSPEAVKAFYEDCQGQLIFKPVSGGLHTAPVTPQDITEDRLAELKKSPVQFQQRIDGVDIRIYVIGEALFAAEIQSQTLDFRDDPAAPIVPIECPEHVQAQCHTLARVLGYQFTGIDCRRTPEGEYVFIEGNPSPMFMHFEKITGYPITQTLYQLLLSA